MRAVRVAPIVTAVVLAMSWFTAAGFACPGGVHAASAASTERTPASVQARLDDVHSPDARTARAVTLARKAMGVVRAARERVDGWEPPAAYAGDRDRAALLGAELTPLVSTMGPIEAKWVATDPRWAALLVRELSAHGVGTGSVVAASFSGSFPALNVAVMAAAHALDARVVAISSVTASTWGANQPGFTWPEMEAMIAAAGVLPVATMAVTLGATSDAGRGLDPEGLAMAQRIRTEAAAALGARVLDIASLDQAIAARLEAYATALGGRRAAAYVNVGGNHASLGGVRAPLRYVEGWTTALPPGAARRASVMVAFVADGTPALNLLNVRRLAREWRLDGVRQ